MRNGARPSRVLEVDPVHWAGVGEADLGEVGDDDGVEEGHEGEGEEHPDDGDDPGHGALGHDVVEADGAHHDEAVPDAVLRALEEVVAELDLAARAEEELADEDNVAEDERADDDHEDGGRRCVDAGGETVEHVH